MTEIDISQLKFDRDGLIPAIVQDFRSREVLMLAYMSRESLQKTLETGRTWFYSRSRERLWMKGESSGNYQLVKDMRYDCDADCLLVLVEQVGVACHTGERSCFLAVSPAGVWLRLQELVQRQKRQRVLTMFLRNYLE
ncbi:phosphoribosyl-AMP cyclohydrolase [Candidatus Hakubella thermalkaliphila]|uniref:Phosphoribosyl-AMP cyclohydrolase n=1 Tax=Candidatus Hakubella thermalkaliphila TaxID=2754717 RepID=A0A6V8PSF6_9ACTN|nr:phosphoribosyl-AMP cyclohydrolase [Candidatus Hakubella thermalkaliphila]GFP35562.1 phosphoribosyl-AMP cyclohydrolase [Candidatus Hakubella thermalkaliphila]